MQFVFATVPNQLANNQVLTVEFLWVLQESNISMYREFRYRMFKQLHGMETV